MPSPSVIVGLALFVAVTCILLLGLLWWLRRRTGIGFPGLSDTRIVASDTGVIPPQLLRDSQLGLYGKPDYLLAEGMGEGRRLIPMELKPRRRATRLYESDEIQLGVYLLATRATYGRQAAGFGFVRYAATTFRVELTAALERRVVEVATAIRVGRLAAVVHRSHEVPARCAGCAMRQNCSESLV
jgi:CRISPR-associated exonuclease Cas4